MFLSAATIQIKLSKSTWMIMPPDPFGCRTFLWLLSMHEYHHQSITMRPYVEYSLESLDLANML